MPMLGIGYQSPLRDLIPIKSLAGPSQDKGKGRAVESMDKGKSEREQSVSLTISNSRVHSMEGVQPSFMTGLTMHMAIAARKVPGSL
jgi:hypothetical protein